jgi:hypothetical protein
MIPETAPDALAPRLTLPQAVEVYERGERDLRDAMELLRRAERSLSEAFGMHNTGVSITDRWNRLNFSHPDDVVSNVRRQCWRQFIERLELRRFMSVRAWEQLQQRIDHEEPPEISIETVTGLARQYEQQLPAMLEQAVVEVFEWLRPPGSEFKTNSELEIGKRVILTWTIEAWNLGHPFHVRYGMDPRLSALENVFSALDGRGSVTKGHYSALTEAINKSPDGTGETPYFRFKCFRKGTLHLEFKRLDLLKRFNAIAGGRRLRPREHSESSDATA